MWVLDFCLWVGADLKDTGNIYIKIIIEIWIENPKWKICVTVYLSERIRKLNQHFSEDKSEIWKASNNYGIKNSDSNKSI